MLLICLLCRTEIIKNVTRPIENIQECVHVCRAFFPRVCVCVCVYFNINALSISIAIFSVSFSKSQKGNKRTDSS